MELHQVSKVNENPDLLLLDDLFGLNLVVPDWLSFLDFLLGSLNISLEVGVLRVEFETKVLE
jgi:hypothetical protein